MWYFIQNIFILNQQVKTYSITLDDCLLGYSSVLLPFSVIVVTLFTLAQWDLNSQPWIRSLLSCYDTYISPLYKFCYHHHQLMAVLPIYDHVLIWGPSPIYLVASFWDLARTRTGVCVNESLPILLATFME